MEELWLRRGKSRSWNLVYAVLLAGCQNDKTLEDPEKLVKAGIGFSPSALRSLAGYEVEPGPPVPAEAN